MSSNFARFTRGDKVLVVAAFLALISLFLPWFQASVEGYTIQSVSGWGTGYGWMAALCLVAAGVYVVLQRTDAGLPKVPVRSALLVLSLTGLGTFLILVRIGTLPHGNAGGLVSYQYGAAAGILLALIAGVIETVCAFLMFRRRNRGVVAAGPQVPGAADESA
jgi:cellobiose-specific phosphotransferase system component IIC